jgi:hypothetical protein
MSDLTTRLQQAIQRLREIPPLQQDEIARLIEGQLIPAPAIILPSYAGSMPDLPDDFEEELMRRRHEVPPTPPMNEQLQELFGDENE